MVHSPTLKAALDRWHVMRPPIELRHLSGHQLRGQPLEGEPLVLHIHKDGVRLREFAPAGWLWRSGFPAPAGSPASGDEPRTPVVAHLGQEVEGFFRELDGHLAFRQALF